MKITIFALYGGIGKTSTAAELSLTSGYQIITNDVYSPLSLILNDDMLLKLPPNQKMPELPDEVDIIFDLGGYPDERAIYAMGQSNYVLVPTKADTNRLKAALDTINEIKKYNSNIVVIVNFAEAGDSKLVKDVLLHNFPKLDIPVFELKKSNAIPNIMTEKKSVHEMVKDGGLKKYHFQSVVNQFDAIMSYLNIL